MKMVNIRLLTVKNVELRTDVLPGATWELLLLRLHCKPCLKQSRKRVQKGNLRGSENNYLGTLPLRVKVTKGDGEKEPKEKKKHYKSKEKTASKRSDQQHYTLLNLVR